MQDVTCLSIWANCLVFGISLEWLFFLCLLMAGYKTVRYFVVLVMLLIALIFSGLWVNIAPEIPIEFEIKTKNNTQTKWITAKFLRPKKQYKVHFLLKQKLYVYLLHKRNCEKHFQVHKIFAPQPGKYIFPKKVFTEDKLGLETKSRSFYVLYDNNPITAPQKRLAHYLKNPANNKMIKKTLLFQKE